MPIESNKEYEDALKKADILVKANPRKGSQKYNELDNLIEEIYVYEEKQFPII